MSNSTTKDSRARVWTFLIYPSSAPDNWREILDSKAIPWVESPLHNPDKDSINKDERDHRHHHCLLSFEGKKSQEQVENIIKELNSTLPFVVDSPRSMVRYFAHLDQPEKEKFAPSDIIFHCGYDCKDYLVQSQDKYLYVDEMMTYIKDNEIIEYHDFVDATRQFHYDTWFRSLCDNTSFIINLYIKSYRHDPKRTKLKLEDNEKVIDVQ